MKKLGFYENSNTPPSAGKFPKTKKDFKNVIKFSYDSTLNFYAYF